MNLKQAAARLGIHYQTAYKLVRAGTLSSVRIGGTYDISEAALERYLAERAAVRRDHVGTPGPTALPTGSERSGERLLLDIAATTRSTSLSAQATFDAVAHGLARALRDGAVVWMATGDGVLDAVACDHWEPRRHSLLTAYTLAVPLATGEGYTGHAFAKGERVFAPHLPQNVLRAGTRPEFVQYLDELAIHSLIAVPVVVAGQAEGMITAARDFTGVPYSVEDLAVVQEAARLTGLAVERAALVGQGWLRRNLLLEALRLGLDAHDAVRVASTTLELVLDPQLRVIGANDAALELLGEQSANLVQQLAASTPSSDAPPLAARLLSGELDFHDDELVVERADGERDHYLVQRGVARTASAEPIGITIVASPVAEVTVAWPAPIERHGRHHLDSLPSPIVPHGNRGGVIRRA